QRARDFDEDEDEADAAEFPDVTEQEARAEQDDACFQPEFVGGYTGFEDFGEADGVGDGQADEDGPEDVFDVGECPVMGFGVEVDVLFEEFAGEADDGKEGYAGEQAEESGADGDGGFWGSAIASAMVLDSL